MWFDQEIHQRRKIVNPTTIYSRCTFRQTTYDWSAHPKDASSEIGRTVKSIVVREMWVQHESFLGRYLWGSGFPKEAYYAGTAGTISRDAVERYIERTEHI